MSACFHHRKDLTRKKNKNHGSHCCSSSIPTVSSAVAFCVRPMTTMTPWETTIELAMTTPTTTTDDPESRRGCLGYSTIGMAGVVTASSVTLGEKETAIAVTTTTTTTGPPLDYQEVARDITQLIKREEDSSLAPQQEGPDARSSCLPFLGNVRV